MKKITLLLGLLVTAALSGFSSGAPVINGNYTLVVEGYDWGPAVSKVILALDEAVTSVNFAEYKVLAQRSTPCVELPAGQATGERRIVHGYVSDAQGNVQNSGKFVTLVLAVAPNMPLASPIQYSRNEKCRGNNWIDYTLNVTHTSSGQSWTAEADRIMPIVDKFDLSGKFEHEGTSLTYASYKPENVSGKLPLIIWLHGGGEGGTDPSIALIANRAANYASREIQEVVGGAYVLVPQTPTYWMDNGQSGYTTGQVNDIYNNALMALIREYVAGNPGIDASRIYIGGCSNGGYMSLKLILLYPDYFAAGYISALAYQSDNISDAEIEKIKNVPIWFVHSKDDSTTVAKETVIPVYERLMAAGAPNVHLSLYDHVVDITGFFGGDDYHYNGHWSWIYCHANVCRKDADGSLVELDGRPVTIMEWLAAQRK